jgi:hypothetical protein
MTELTDRERIEILEREVTKLTARVNELEEKKDQKVLVSAFWGDEVMEEFAAEESRVRRTERGEVRRDESEMEAFATDWS